MDLRKQLSSYIALNNYVEAIRENTSSVVLTDAIHNGLTGLQLKGSEVKNKPETFLDSIIAKGKTEQRNLPDGYTQLEYIVFDSTQVIDTGFTPNNNSRIESKCYKTGADCWFYGASPLNPRVTLYHSRAGICRWGNQSRSNVGFVADTEYTIIEDKNGLNINGVDNPWTSGTAGDFTCDRSLTIGNSNGSTGTRYFAGNFYYMKIYDNGVLARDFVPCKNASNVVGLYDRVNGVFYTDTGLVAGPSVVPTPDTPMDIVSNNGVLKARHASGLPLGYTLVDGITANGTQYIDTGIKIASTDTVETEFKISTLTDYGAVYGIYATGESSAFYANQTYYSYDKSNNKVNTNVAVDNQWHTVVHDFVNGTLQLDDTTVTFTPFVFANANNNGLFTRFYNGSYGYFLKGSVKSHKITRNGTVIFNAVSVQRDSDSALGMYDFVSGTFFTNQGTGTFTAGNPVSDPVEIYTDGTVETIEDTIGNTATAEMLLKVGNYQDAQSIIDGTVTRNVKAIVLTGTETWIPYSTYSNVYVAGIAVGKPSGGIAPICNYFAGYSTYISMTANDYGILGSSAATIAIKNKDCVDVTAFTTWLADQYAAGTPVIVVYPLKTPTTETVSSQKLLKNPVIVTEASIDNLEVTTTETEHTVPTPDYPLDIVCNNGVLRVGPNNSVIVEGTPETVTITGKNLFNKNGNLKTGTYRIDSGVWVDNDQFRTLDHIPAKPGVSYTLSAQSTSETGGNAFSVQAWDSTHTNWLGTIASTTAQNIQYASGISPAGTAYLSVSFAPSYRDINTLQLEECSRPTQYEEYYQVFFAPEDLLKLSDYQDVQDVINGIKSKKIGFKILDGTEDWIKTATYTNLYEMSIKNDGALYGNIMFALTSTHLIGTAEINVNMPDNSIKLTTRGVDRTDPLIFIKTSQGNDTLAGFKQFLADQYTLGTPVIIVYPLADTVEETVESRDVFITSGTNTIERNSEYVSSGDITVEYKKLR